MQSKIRIDILPGDVHVFLINTPGISQYGLHQTISEIMKIVQIEEQSFPEILDIVNLLIDNKVVEKK